MTDCSGMLSSEHAVIDFPGILFQPLLTGSTDCLGAGGLSGISMCHFSAVNLSSYFLSLLRLYCSITRYSVVSFELASC